MTKKSTKRIASYDAKVDDKPIAITPIEYGGLQEAYDHFNAALFEGGLPDVFITYQRKANSFGYFSPDRFSGRIGEFGNRHELALNPDAFVGQTDEQICQTLVHEMVHGWQEQPGNGKPSTRNYHNKEWAAKMKAIGLQPSSTGMVGGKETGAKMLDYIIPDGPFTKAYAKLAATGWKLNLQSAHRPGPKGGTNSKTKFTCSACKSNAWGKPDLGDACPDCLIPALRIELNADAAAKAIALVERYRRRSADALVAVPAATPAALPLFEPDPSYDETPPSPTPGVEAEPPKRKRGRPKGSRNKPKADAQLAAE
jgi:hypothetical protein